MKRSKSTQCQLSVPTVQGLTRLQLYSSGPWRFRGQVLYHLTNSCSRATTFDNEHLVQGSFGSLSTNPNRVRYIRVSLAVTAQ